MTQIVKQNLTMIIALSLVWVVIFQIIHILALVSFHLDGVL